MDHKSSEGPIDCVLPPRQMMRARSQDRKPFRGEEHRHTVCIRFSMQERCSGNIKAPSCCYLHFVSLVDNAMLTSLALTHEIGIFDYVNGQFMRVLIE